MGVVIDHTLCLKPHINHVETKMSKSIAVLHKRHFQTKFITYIVLFFNSSIHFLLYGGLGKCFILQKRAIRIVNRADYNESTNTLFINSCVSHRLLLLLFVLTLFVSLCIHDVPATILYHRQILLNIRAKFEQKVSNSFLFCQLSESLGALPCSYHLKNE